MLLAVTQSAFEGFVAYVDLVSQWGDPLVLGAPVGSARVVAGNLQPMFIAPGTHFYHFNCHDDECVQPLFSLNFSLPGGSGSSAWLFMGGKQEFSSLSLAS